MVVDKNAEFIRFYLLASESISRWLQLKASRPSTAFLDERKQRGRPLASLCVGLPLCDRFPIRSWLINKSIGESQGPLAFLQPHQRSVSTGAELDVSLGGGQTHHDTLSGRWWERKLVFDVLDSSFHTCLWTRNARFSGLPGVWEASTASSRMRHAAFLRRGPRVPFGVWYYWALYAEAERQGCSRCSVSSHCHLIESSCTVRLHFDDCRLTFKRALETDSFFVLCITAVSKLTH